MNLLSIGSRRSKIGLLIVFALAFGFYACDGGGGGDEPADTTAPTVDFRSPASGATKVLTNATVTATFSEAMDATTITTSTFTLNEASAVTGSVSYNAGTLTATFVPTNSLKPGTAHTATLTTTVADLAGNGLASANAWSFTTEDFIYRMSVDSSGTEANGDNNGVTISADGRYVGFYSDGDNLVTGDTNGVADTFIHDMLTGTTTRISVASDGTQGDNESDETPAISADGRYVAFSSHATNLVTGDTNATQDIFVRDTVNNTTTRVSVDSSGTQGNSNSYTPLSMSADGRYVAFSSSATNLVTGDTNAAQDVFVRDTVNNTTTRVSVDSSGTQANIGSSSWAPSISADGRYVAFHSTATNLVTGDTNAAEDVFVRDTVNNTTTRVSVDSSGTQGNGNSSWSSISEDGRYVAFHSHATNLVTGDTNARRDVFVHDTVNNTTTRVSVDSSGTQGNSGSESMSLSLSSDGRYVAFTSDATNLVANDINGMADIFVRDTLNNTTIRINLDSSGTESDADSHSAVISADGRYVAFISDATNLVTGDTNAIGDIFRALNTVL